MPRLVLGLLLLACGCAPSTVWRRTQAAQGFERFKVVTTVAPPEIRHDMGLPQIARLFGAAGSGSKTQGLSLIKHAMATHTRFGTAGDGSSVSAWFDDVIITLSISPVTVYVPKEYPQGSCEYQVVRAHEEEHRRAAAAAAAAAAVALESAVSAAPDMPVLERPLVFKTRGKAADFLKAKLALAVGPVYERFERDLAAAQAALDRPSVYRLVYRRCNGWK